MITQSLTLMMLLNSLAYLSGCVNGLFCDVIFRDPTVFIDVDNSESTSSQVKDGKSNPRESFLNEKKQFLTFEGKVRYSNKIGDCGYVCEAILEKLETLEELVVGFDLEWPVQWTKGAAQCKTALIQICPSLRVCYLFHVTEWKSLPKVFVDFISHPKVRLVGVNIKGDIWKLGRDFDISVVQIIGCNTIELRSLANQVFSTQEIWSLDRLVLYVLKKQLDKSNVRTSNWAQETLTAHQLGYAATDAYALIIQKKVANHIKTLMTEEMNPSGAVLLVEHYPVYTIGLRTKQYSVKDEEKLKKLGAEFYKTDRGGLITFHGPGQLVVYPILNLKRFRPSVKWYVCTIEKVVIDLCRQYGLKAETSPDTGVWVGDKKICAVGIHGSRFVTTHGFALNCSTDLKWFSHIVPCGIEGKGVTSISNELCKTVTPLDVLPRLTECFTRGFTCKLGSVRDYTDIDVLLRSIH